jgi:hypothetical protein
MHSSDKNKEIYYCLCIQAVRLAGSQNYVQWLADLCKLKKINYTCAKPTLQSTAWIALISKSRSIVDLGNQKPKINML